MSNKPVTPWNELEGRFFKVDVGSTTAEAITNDHQTGEPVVHYTTDGDIVFNGMKFCQQGGAKRFNKLIVHKAIPMTPEKGNFYYFRDGWIKFKVDLDRLDDSAVFRFPSVGGLTISDENIVAYPNHHNGLNTTASPFKIENIEGKTVADIKKLMLSKMPYANRFFLVRYIRDYKDPVLVTTTRNVNLYDNAETVALQCILTEELHQFMVDRGCCFASRNYKINEHYNIAENRITGRNNNVVYCATPNIPKKFVDLYSFCYRYGRSIKLFRYKRRRRFYYKIENGIRKKYEVTKNGRKTYFRVRRSVTFMYSQDKNNYTIMAYAKLYRKGKSSTYSTEEVRVIIFNENGVLKIKKF